MTVHNRRLRLSGVTMLAPLVIGLTVFAVYPFVFLVVLSFSDSTLASQFNGWLGWDNFTWSFEGTDFPETLRRDDPVRALRIVHPDGCRISDCLASVHVVQGAEIRAGADPAAAHDAAGRCRSNLEAVVQHQWLVQLGADVTGPHRRTDFVSRRRFLRVSRNHGRRHLAMDAVCRDPLLRGPCFVAEKRVRGGRDRRRIPPPDADARDHPDAVAAASGDLSDPAHHRVQDVRSRLCSHIRRAGKRHQYLELRNLENRHARVRSWSGRSTDADPRGRRDTGHAAGRALAQACGRRADDISGRDRRGTLCTTLRPGRQSAGAPPPSRFVRMADAGAGDRGDPASDLLFHLDILKTAQ